MSSTSPATKARSPWRPSELAHEFKVSVATIHRLIAAGEIRAFKIGTQFRIPDLEVDRLRPAPAHPPR